MSKTYFSFTKKGSSTVYSYLKLKYWKFACFPNATILFSKTATVLQVYYQSFESFPFIYELISYMCTWEIDERMNMNQRFIYLKLNCKIKLTTNIWPVVLHGILHTPSRRCEMKALRYNVNWANNLSPYTFLSHHTDFWSSPSHYCSIFCQPYQF